MKRVATVIVSLVFLSGSAALAQDAAKMIAAGKQVYTDQKCATCHQIAGQGGKSSTALDKVGSKLSADDLKKWLTDTATMESKLPAKPKVPMAGFMKSKKLSDTDVSNLVAYLSSLK